MINLKRAKRSVLASAVAAAMAAAAAPYAAASEASITSDASSTKSALATKMGVFTAANQDVLLKSSAAAIDVKGAQKYVKTDATTKSLSITSLGASGHIYLKQNAADSVTTSTSKVDEILVKDLGHTADANTKTVYLDKAAAQSITAGAAVSHQQVWAVKSGDTSNTTMTGHASDTVGRKMFADGGNDTITGGAAGDIITGGSGADSIDGGAGNDEIAGEAGADILKGGLGADSIYGGADNDTITGGGANDVIDGGAGTLDTAVYTENKSQCVWTSPTLNCGAHTDTLTTMEKIQFADQTCTIGTNC